MNNSNELSKILLNEANETKTSRKDEQINESRLKNQLEYGGYRSKFCGFNMLAFLACTEEYRDHGVES